MAVICNNCGEENLDIDTECSNCGEGLYYDTTLPEGTILENRYEIKELITFGGMGAIYLASDQRLSNRNCAIKEMLYTYGNIQEKQYAEKRFKEESSLLSKLDHYNLPTIHDYFIEKGRYYLVMNYIEGVNLKELLEMEGNPGLPEELVIEWSLQILDVLDYLHNQNPPIVYRDVKPGNIMLNKDGKIILIDFGIARTINPDKKMEYTAIGTDGYAPEEQYRGQVEPRSDLYSLGATMHHLLTGQIPVAFNLKPVRNIAPWVSTEVESIIMKAIEFEARRRYTCAKEMKLAITSREKTAVIKGQKQSNIPSPKEINDMKSRKPVSFNEIKEMLDKEKDEDNLELQGKKDSSYLVVKKSQKIEEQSGKPKKPVNAEEIFNPYKTLKLTSTEKEQVLSSAGVGGALENLLGNKDSKENEEIPPIIKLASVNPKDFRKTNVMPKNKPMKG